MMDIHRLVCVICSLLAVNAVEYQLHIDTHAAIGVTEKEYLSVCLDPYLKQDLSTPWGTLNFTSPKLHTLMRGLAPTILRFGGTDADWSVFYNVTSQSEQEFIWKLRSTLTDPGGQAFVVPIFPQDVDHLIALAQSARGQLLFDLNIQQRFGAQWDVTNALQIIEYVSTKHGMQNVFFELGNEPNYPQFNFTGERIAKDFQILRNSLDKVESYLGVNKVRLVGPDIGIAGVPWLVKIMSDFAKYGAKTVSAITLHHYYFKGPGSKLDQYYDLMHFNSYERLLQSWRDVIYDSAGIKVPIWVGETSDSYDKGGPNITDRYVSGFLWLDKLGISAKLGIKLVARQDLYGGNYPLLDKSLNPNPDYWLSYVFKQLVSDHVLNVSITSNSSDPYLRTYAHCDCQDNIINNITVFMINLNQNDTASVRVDTQYGDHMKVYFLTPGDGGLLSKQTKVNGNVLKLIDDQTLPQLKPMVVDTKSPVHLKPLTFAFVVFDTQIGMACDS